MRDKLLTCTHLIIAILAATSFLWLDIKIILIGLVLYYLQLIVVGSCVLSVAQFKNKDTVFLGIYINKLLRLLHIKELSIKQQKIFMRYIEPMTILFLAILLQVVLKFKPII